MAIAWMSQVEMLRELVAASSTFQTVVGAGSASAAKSSIAMYAAVEDYLSVPRAVIHFTGTEANNQGINNWTSRHQLYVSFEFDQALPDEDADGINDSHGAFMDNVEAILQEMMDTAGTGEPVAGRTHLYMTGMTLVDGPELRAIAETDLVDPDTATQKCVWWITFQIDTF